MDVIKYRKLYLSENWGYNPFIMIRKNVSKKYDNLNHPFDNLNHPFDDLNHPLVLSGNAYWITQRQLCIGYQLNGNSKIFRPIFSHKRQLLMDNLLPNIKNPDKFWKRIKSRYFLTLVKIKKLPIVCVDNIIVYVC